MPQDRSAARYEDRQDQANDAARKAWRMAPKSFLEAAGKRGLAFKVEKPNQAVICYEDNHSSTAYEVDMAGEMDTAADELIERLGSQHEAIIRLVVEEMQIPMEQEIERRKAMTLGRIACYLVKGESGNVLARIHGLLWSIHGLAKINGFKSMRDSALACGVSVEWISKTRKNWCAALGLEVPIESAKSEEAKAKYQAHALENHWRGQSKAFKTAASAT